MGNSYGRYSDRQSNVAFSTTALSFATTSPCSEPRRISASDLYRQKSQAVGYIFDADSIFASPSILKQSCLKSRASMLNDSTRKKVFNAKWLFKVIQGQLFRCRWKAIGRLHTRRNNFVLIYKLWKDITITRSKMAIFDDPSYLMPPVQRNNPTNIGIILISTQSTISALHFRCILVMASERQAHNFTEWIIALQGHPRSSICVPIKARVHIPISGHQQLGPYLSPFQR